jgi:hypothetical protein
VNGNNYDNNFGKYEAVRSYIIEAFESERNHDGIWEIQTATGRGTTENAMAHALFLGLLMGGLMIGLGIDAPFAAEERPLAGSSGTDTTKSGWANCSPNR